MCDRVVHFCFFMWCLWYSTSSSNYTCGILVLEFRSRICMYAWQFDSQCLCEFLWFVTMYACMDVWIPVTFHVYSVIHNIYVDSCEFMWYLMSMCFLQPWLFERELPVFTSATLADVNTGRPATFHACNILIGFFKGRRDYFALPRHPANPATSPGLPRQLFTSILPSVERWPTWIF